MSASEPTRVPDALALDDRFGLDGDAVAAGELHLQRRQRLVVVLCHAPARARRGRRRPIVAQPRVERARELRVVGRPARLRDDQPAAAVRRDVAAVADADDRCPACRRRARRAAARTGRPDPAARARRHRRRHRQQIAPCGDGGGQPVRAAAAAALRRGSGRAAASSWRSASQPKLRVRSTTPASTRRDLRRRAQGRPTHASISSAYSAIACPSGAVKTTYSWSRLPKRARNARNAWITRLSRGSSDSTSASNDRRRVPSMRHDHGERQRPRRTTSAPAMRPSGRRRRPGIPRTRSVCYILRPEHECPAAASRARERAIRPRPVLPHRAARHGIHRRGARSARPPRHARRSALQPLARRRRCARSRPGLVGIAAMHALETDEVLALAARVRALLAGRADRRRRPHRGRVSRAVSRTRT